MGFWDTLNTVSNSLGADNNVGGYNKWARNHISDGRNTKYDYSGYLLKPLDVSISILAPKIGSNGLTRGNSKTQDENGKLPVKGFTPDLDYITDWQNLNNPITDGSLPLSGYPIERGAVLKAGIIQNGRTLGGNALDTNFYANTKSGSILGAYTAFDSTEHSNLDEYKFKHNLDPDEIDLSGKDIYLTSLNSTQNRNGNSKIDNEDPVSFGYDIIIKYASSPLFNGGIEYFINSFSDYSEIYSRLDIVRQFKQQFFKFFRIDSPSSIQDSDGNNLIQGDEFGGKYVAKTYYLKKIVGLDNLTETINSDKSKQFIDYGNDYLTLTLNEDVTINMGYLASLYKILTWSRINGKKMFPDNLLRFDMEIVVTEARKFNSAKKNRDNTISNYADIISRYRYKVHECQFFFENVSHDGTIDMSALDQSQGFDIKINYKFSTLQFEWLNDRNFDNEYIQEKTKAFVNNGLYSTDTESVRKYDLTRYESGTNQTTLDNNKITTYASQYSFNTYGFDYSPNPNVQSNNISGSQLNDANNSTPIQDNYAVRFETYKQNLNNGAKPSNITLREQLIQQTISNITQQFGGIGSLLINISGFTNDGWQYNVPAYYLNRTLNQANNSIYTALGLSKPSKRSTYKIQKDKDGSWQYDLPDLKTEESKYYYTGYGFRSPNAKFNSHYKYHTGIDGLEIDYSGWLERPIKYFYTGYGFSTPNEKHNSHYINGYSNQGFEYDLPDWKKEEGKYYYTGYGFTSPNAKFNSHYINGYSDQGFEYDLPDWKKEEGKYYYTGYGFTKPNAKFNSHYINGYSDQGFEYDLPDWKKEEGKYY